MSKKVRFMCTAFRDGFQSVYGARVLTRDFLPALEAARAFLLVIRRRPPLALSSVEGSAGCRPTPNPKSEVANSCFVAIYFAE